MKKTSMKIVLIAAALVLALVCLTACGGGEKKEDAAAPAASADAFTGDKFTYDGNLPVKKEDMPEGYTLVPHEKFMAAYKALVDSIEENATITTSSTYNDVATLFGQEGVMLPINEKFPDYVTYYWFSDAEYNVTRYYSLSVTFKKVGDQLTYYAYSSTDVTQEDVR